MTITKHIELKNVPIVLEKWIKDHLTINNPDYEKNIRLGFWNGNTPKTLDLYEKIDDSYIVPFGIKDRLEAFFIQRGLPYEKRIKHIKKPIEIDYRGDITLFDYQLPAIKGMLSKDNGILISPTGSGKTLMALYLLRYRQVKTLWITHTHDLLRQSKNTAKKLYGNSIGEISDGKVDIQDITFAMVQTLDNLDLTKYQDEWEQLIIDETHRATGTPTKVKMFYKIITNLNARYKLGVTATLFPTKNGMDSVPFHLIGDVLYEVKKENIKRVNAIHVPVYLDTKESDYYLNTDRTLKYMDLVDYLVYNQERNNAIVDELIKHKNEYNFVLSNRNDHLKLLIESISRFTDSYHLLIGGEKKKNREKILNDFREGKINYLFSNYQLAKEGLDVPIANRLHLVFPVKDKITLIQSKGRVERIHSGKNNALVLDYVDSNIGYLNNIYKLRRRILK